MTLFEWPPFTINDGENVGLSKFPSKSHRIYAADQRVEDAIFTTGAFDEIDSI
jgi:hypothetical protein